MRSQSGRAHERLIPAEGGTEARAERRRLAPADRPTAPPQRITRRAALVGMLGGSALAVLNPYSDYVARTLSIGWGSLPIAVVFALFLLVTVNGLLVRLSPRRALDRRELLVAYGTMTISFPLVRIYLPYLFGTLSYAFYRASPENDWEHLIWPHVPTWFRLATPEAANWFWEGLPKGQGIPWGAWATPLLAWGAFTCALMAAMFCLATLVRRDWIERQRLAFPLVEIPLALVGDQAAPSLPRSIFRNRIFWVGFAIPAGISLLHWLSRLFPAVPDPTLEFFPGRGLTAMGLPWSVLGDMRVRVYFSEIGVCALVPVEVSLSLWFFYLLTRAVRVALAGFGLTGAGNVTVSGFDPRAFISFAEVGGFLALAAAVLWQSRANLGAAARGLLGTARPEPDPSAPLSLRGALLGFLLANGFMLWWATKAGASWWTFALLTGFFYAMEISCSRLVAAAGVMRADAPIFPFARDTMLRWVGAAAVGPTSLTVIAYISITYMLDIDSAPMPQMLNSFKLLHGERMQGRRFPWAAAAVAVTVIAAGSVALLRVAYGHGATTVACWPFTGAALCTFRELDTSLHTPEVASNWLRSAMVSGAGFMLFLIWMSARFIWWPVSPVGFIIADSYFTNYGLWFNALAGWGLATVVRKYGGLRLYRTVRPAFLGLVLGELLTRSVLGVISLLFGIGGGDAFALS